MESGCFIQTDDYFTAEPPWQAIGSIARRLLAEIAAPRFEGATRGAGEEHGPSRARPVSYQDATGEKMQAADGPTDVRRQSAAGFVVPMGTPTADGTECRAPGLGGNWKPRRARRPREVDPADEGDG